MIMTFLLQLTPVQRGVKEHFARGGSLGAVLLLLAAIVAVVLLVYAITRLRDHLSKPPRINDPKRLYADLLAALPLESRQREFLRRLAADSALPHPTALLLSPRLFDRAVQRWRRKAADTAGKWSDTVARTHRVLFPPQA